MLAKKESEVILSKKELKHQWVLWYRGSICAELKKKPRSQSELFIGLARRDGKPNPKTRGHPSLMPPPAAAALEELSREKVVERERSERLIMFRLAGKPAPLVRKPYLASRRPPARTAPAVNKAVRAERWKDRRSDALERSPQKLEDRLVSLDERVSGLQKAVENLEKINFRLDNLDRRLGVFEEQVGKVARSVKAIIAEPRPAASEAGGGD